MKREKAMTLKDELPRSAGAQDATGNQWRKEAEWLGLRGRPIKLQDKKFAPLT